ncbi:MAG: efflux RND transporter periplasmic adaptor subunit [Bacteroidetes bacterium]|nr:MAG: efflux RND transporter periplasmic adaptor subunit [Bacteroidota bacterium]
MAYYNAIFQQLSLLLMTNKYWLTAMACAGFIACGSKKNKAPLPPPAKDKATVVNVIIAQPQPFQSFLEVNGSVVAFEQIAVQAEVSGRLTYLNIPEGAVVQQGTILAKIYNADLLAQLQKSKASLTLAAQNEARLKKLLAVEGVNQADYDAVANQVSSLQADIAYTQALIEKTVIKAPFTGVVGLKQVGSGAIVTPQTTITTLQKNNDLRVDFTVPETYLAYLKKGQSVQVLYSKDTLTATIQAMEPQANTTTRNFTVRAKIASQNLATGAFVKVRFAEGDGTNKILVPTNAIIPESKGKKMVLVKNGKAQFIQVITGSRQPGVVEITKGITPGDSVVVTGVLFVKPDAAVTVRAVKQLANIIQP